MKSGRPRTYIEPNEGIMGEREPHEEYWKYHKMDLHNFKSTENQKLIVGNNILYQVLITESTMMIWALRNNRDCK